ncbi:hypothetical protein STEG23_029964 [Scotinomys teguina]
MRKTRCSSYRSKLSQTLSSKGAFSLSLSGAVTSGPWALFVCGGAGVLAKYIFLLPLTLCPKSYKPLIHVLSLQLKSPCAYGAAHLQQNLRRSQGKQVLEDKHGKLVVGAQPMWQAEEMLSFSTEAMHNTV